MMEDFAVHADKYLGTPSRDPQWQVDGIWSYKSHGIWAGEAKTRKTYLACDFAVSVATGTPFLNHFPVKRSGPVLMIQEELSDAELRKRLRRIATSRGLGGEIGELPDGRIFFKPPKAFPLFLRNRKQFNLQDGEQLNDLRDFVKDEKIKLVIFDPLGLMLGSADENHAAQIRPVLNDLLKLKEATGTGILLLHHYAKASLATAGRVGGQRMLGTQAFHGWVESALYIEKPDAYEAKITREFRNFPISPEEFSVEYIGGDEDYEVVVTEKKERAREKLTPFEKFCLKHPGTSLKAIAKHFDLSLNTVKSRIQRSAHLDFGEKKIGAGRPAKTVEVK